MVKQWMHRMSWLYSAWIDAGRVAPFRYGDELMMRYQEPADFTNSATSMEAVAARRRIEQLRSLVPIGTGH